MDGYDREIQLSGFGKASGGDGTRQFVWEAAEKFNVDQMLDFVVKIINDMGCLSRASSYPWMRQS